MASLRSTIGLRSLESDLGCKYPATGADPV
jgi:hypothetical protein